MLGADRRQRTSGRDGECDEFLDDTEHKHRPVRYRELPVQAATVGVNGVGRNSEIGSDGKFRTVIKNVAQDLQFACR